MKKKLLIVTAAIITPVIFVGLRRNSAPLFSVEKYQCVQDAALSDDYFSSINNALADLCDKHCAAHVIIDQLKQQFPVINKITIAYRPTATHVTLSVHEPVCCLNNSIILTTQKELFPKHVFAEDALTDILNITCHLPCDASSTAQTLRYTPTGHSQTSHKASSGTAGRADVSSLVTNLLQKLPCNMSESYNIELMAEHCVRFTDKQQPQFVIVSSLAQEKLAQLCTQCKEVKRTITEKNGFDKGIKWVADTRFAHYIVAYKA